MTKEEIANIKRIDTSLNVFRKKLETVEAKIAKLVEPLNQDRNEMLAEIDFWQEPVLKRYGKTTTELLREAGEETASDVSTEEAGEKVTEPEKPSEPEANVDTPNPPSAPTAESNPENAETSDDLPVDLPEEWK